MVRLIKPVLICALHDVGLATRGNVRNVNATVLCMRLIRTATHVNAR